MEQPHSGNTPTKPCYVVLEPITPKLNPEFSTELKRVINERNLLTTKTRKRVTDDLEQIENESREAARCKKRAKICEEIIESEENYLRQLEVIMEFFIKPVKEKHLLKSRDFDILFGDLTSIHQISKELLKALRTCSNRIGEAFSKIAPFFKSFSFYALGFKSSMQILQNCHKNNPKFGKFLEMQESRPEVQSKLSALLIVPIQRVPRYKLLLSSLIKITSAADTDYDNLTDSLNKIQEAASHINRIIKDQENIQRLLELQRCLQNSEPNVITPGRNLLKEGFMLSLNSKTNHSQKMYVVLMNDIIMFSKMKRDELKVNSLKCAGIFPLSKCKIQPVHDKGAFKVLCENEEICLYHDSYCETVKWVDDIEDAIKMLANDRKTLKKESTVRRPVKRKDVSEYNEVGVSPGKKLKKRQIYFEDTRDLSGPLLLTKRRPIKSDFANGTPSFLVTLKPEVSDQNKEPPSDLFVFGNENEDRGFSFKMGQWFCGIGSSVKRLFGFGQN